MVSSLFFQEPGTADLLNLNKAPELVAHTPYEQNFIMPATARTHKAYTNLWNQSCFL